MIVVGIFYPHEEEHINIISAQSEGTIDNQRKVDDTIVKGRLLYDVSSVERPHPWREVFKDISSTDLLSQSDETIRYGYTIWEILLAMMKHHLVIVRK